MDGLSCTMNVCNILSIFHDVQLAHLYHNEYAETEGERKRQKSRKLDNAVAYTDGEMKDANSVWKT